MRFLGLGHTLMMVVVDSSALLMNLMHDKSKSSGKYLRNMVYSPCIMIMFVSLLFEALSWECFALWVSGSRIFYLVKIFFFFFGIITRIVPSLGAVYQIGTRFKKSVNCIPTFEKVLQLGPFQTELTNAVSQHAMWLF